MDAITALRQAMTEEGNAKRAFDSHIAHGNENLDAGPEWHAEKIRLFDLKQAAQAWRIKCGYAVEMGAPAPTRAEIAAFNHEEA